MKPVYQRPPRPAHDPDFAAKAKQLSRALLALHRELMLAVQREYEVLSGPIPPLKLLELLMSDPWFAWLRPLSTATAQLDELLDTETDRAPYRALAQELRVMLEAERDDHPFAERFPRYRERPEIVLATTKGRRALEQFEAVL